MDVKRVLAVGAHPDDAAATGAMHGVTTNPSLIAREGRSFAETVPGSEEPARIWGFGGNDGDGLFTLTP